MKGFQWSWYSYFYLVTGLLVLAVELWAIYHPRKHDTISEHVWALRAHNPFWIWLIVFFMVWAIVHFVTEGRFA